MTTKTTDYQKPSLMVVPLDLLQVICTSFETFDSLDTIEEWREV